MPFNALKNVEILIGPRSKTIEIPRCDALGVSEPIFDERTQHRFQQQ